jgi:hypothetical protein
MEDGMRKAAMLLIAVCAACSSPASPEADSTPLIQGQWDYTASQTNPQLTMTGTLTITVQTQNEITGSIDYMELDAASITRHRVEMFSGRIRGNGSVTIDAGATDGTRRHIGVLVNDSMGGNFERPGSGNGQVSGTFSARRR